MIDREVARAEAAKRGPAPSPFVRATKDARRFKFLIYGDAGAGKSTTGLLFPRPVVLDLEGGTTLYGDRTEFDVGRPRNLEELGNMMRALAAGDHEYETVVVDPVSEVWAWLQRLWTKRYLARNTTSAGHRGEFYRLQPADWGNIKADFRSFLQRLVALNTHLVLTAREKPIYAEGEFMRQVGTTFDCDRSVAYFTDAVVHLRREAGGKHVATTVKDRSGLLPKGEFTPDVEAFRPLFS